MRKPKTIKIRSNFNRNEKFDCEHMPKHFDSVTDESIRGVRNYCAYTVGQKYHGSYDAIALRAMIETIDGSFDELYAKLEGDYSARRSNLDFCRQSEKSKVRAELTDFANLVSEHNVAFDDFAHNVQEFNGTILDESLRYPQQKIKAYESRIDALKEK